MVETETLLVLSTGHLTESCCNRFLSDHDGPWHEKADYGWFVHVEATHRWDLELIPMSLLDCIDFAADNNCEWIMFDRDGPQEDQLTYYDW